MDHKTEKKESKIGKFFKAIGRFLKKHIKLCIVLVIILAIVLYVRHSVKVAQQMLEEQANQPVTATLEVKDLTKSVSVTGTLNANDLKTVTSSIGGTGITGVKVAKVNFKEGDYVEAGDVVVTFDGDDYNRQIAELNAKYAIDNQEAMNSLTDYTNQIADLQKEIEEDQKWLDDKYIYYKAVKDYKEAADKCFWDAETVAKYQETAEIVQRRDGVTIENYEEKQKGIEKKQKQIDDLWAKAQIASKRNEFNQTYTQVDSKKDVYESMEKTQVSAPFSGYIITMNVAEGNNYTQGTTVFTIADTSGYTVEATVNEYDVASIQQGLPAVVKFEATGDEEFKGEVTYVSLASEASISGGSSASTTYSNMGTVTNATATYKVKIKLAEKDDRLRVGMTAKASVVLDSVDKVFAAPYDCVQEKDDGTFFVTEILEDGTKKDIPVTKGLESDYYIEVKGDGLKEGMTLEAIVTDAPSTDLMDYVTVE